MRTRVEVIGQELDKHWEGDLPIIPKGCIVDIDYSGYEVAKCIIMLDADGGPVQLLRCNP
jgi:hypothetical protein